MIHQFLDKKQISKRNKRIKNIILLCLFLFLSAIGLSVWTGKFVNLIGRPIWKVENFISKQAYNFNYLFRTKASISDENHKLIEEISDLKARMANYQIIKNELDDIKEIMGRMPTPEEFIIGNILTKPDHSPYDTIVIDVGSSYAIAEGDKVYANGAVPIGIISKVYDGTSLVTLYTNPGQKTEGSVSGSNITVELIGRGGGNFEMIVPLELQIEKGMLIYLPGDTSEAVAIVGEIISLPSDPFKKVILSSPINVQNLRLVEIEKNK